MTSSALNDLYIVESAMIALQSGAKRIVALEIENAEAELFDKIDLGSAINTAAASQYDISPGAMSAPYVRRDDRSTITSQTVNTTPSLLLGAGLGAASTLLLKRS